MKKFKILRCPKCGEIQVSEAKTLRCKVCDKTTKIFQKKGLGVVVFKSYDTGYQANKVITRLKNEIVNNKENRGWKEYTT